MTWTFHPPAWLKTVTIIITFTVIAYKCDWASSWMLRTQWEKNLGREPKSQDGKEKNLTSWLHVQMFWSWGQGWGWTGEGRLHPDCRRLTCLTVRNHTTQQAGQGRKVSVANHVRLLVNPQTVNCPGSLQARILDQVVISSSKGSSWPRDRTWVLHWREILYHLSHQGSKEGKPL